MTIFYLIRHGATTAGSKLVGRNPGIDLSPLGNKQAALLAEYLSPVKFDYLFSSPMERTRQTARYIADKQNLETIIIDDLVEVDFGSWSGKSFKELEVDKQWKLYHQFRSGTRPPDGEMVTEIQARMVTTIEKLRKKHEGKTIAVVTHGDPIRTVLTYYLGLHLDFMLRLKVDLACFSIIEINDWGPEVKAMNVSPSFADKEGLQ